MKLFMYSTALPVLMSTPLQVNAEETENKTNSEQVEIIEVTGIRGSLERSLDNKRTASSVVDAISAEDVGKFPDLNIAESVQRITGVQISRNRGEGEAVNIRGLPSEFTMVTLNGRALPNAISPGDYTMTRSFDFTILPSDFIRTLEVYKSPTADLTEGGLSGTINIETPKAGDFSEQVFQFSLDGEYSDYAETTSPRASVFFADQSEDGRFSYAVGGAYQKRDFESHSHWSFYIPYNEAGGLGGAGPQDLNSNGIIEDGSDGNDPTTVRAPINFYNLYPVQSNRTNLLGSLEFQLSDEANFYMEGLYSKLDFESTRYEFLPFLGNSSDLVSSRAIMMEGADTAVDLRVANLDLRSGGRFEDRSGDLWNIVTGINVDTGAWQANLEFSHSESAQIRNNLNLENTAAIDIDGEALVAQGDNVVSQIFHGDSASKILDPNSYKLLSLNGEFLKETSDEINDMRLDLKYLSDWDMFTSLSFGISYSDRRQYQDAKRLVVDAKQINDILANGALEVSNGDSVYYTAAPYMIPIEAANGDFLGSSGADVVKAWIGSDTQGFLSNFSNDELIAAGSFTNSATGIIDVSEQIAAAYIRTDFELDNGFSGNIGLRVVETNQSSVGVSPDLNGISVNPSAGNVTTVPAAEAIEVKRSYTELLPSANLRWDLTDDLLMRASMSRTIARPNLSDVSPTTFVDGVTATITRKNPYLDPFKSDNYDFTAEWYFDEGSLAGAALFYKDIKSLISGNTTSETLPVTIINGDGSTTPSSIVFATNELTNGSGVNLKGIELYYQTYFNMLPEPFDGLGMQANYTYIDNSDPEQLTAASKNNANVSAFYEKGPLSVRFSYTWRDSYLNSSQGGFNMGTERQAYGTLDGSISYDINDNLSLSLQAVNLTDEADNLKFTTNLPNQITYSGRRILFGIRGKL